MIRFVAGILGLVACICCRVGRGSLPLIINIRCLISAGGSHCGGSQIQSSVRLRKHILLYYIVESEILKITQ
jgi:hypothetical protein